MPVKLKPGAPCCEEGCHSPRAVTRSGEVLNRCRPHQNAYRKECNRLYRDRHPGFNSRTARVYAERHPDEKKAQDHRYYESHKEKAAAQSKAWHAAHPGVAIESSRRFKVNHPERVADARRQRREGSYVYHRLNPWPTDCQVCGLPLNPDRKHSQFRQDQLASSLGHEPPLAWVRRHPEYEGPLTLRPEHWGCNLRKKARPDWEL
jgi:hypothetical protein